MARGPSPAGPICGKRGCKNFIFSLEVLSLPKDELSFYNCRFFFNPLPTTPKHIAQNQGRIVEDLFGVRHGAQEVGLSTHFENKGRPKTDGRYCASDPG